MPSSDSFALVACVRSCACRGSYGTGTSPAAGCSKLMSEVSQYSVGISALVLQ